MLDIIKVIILGIVEGITEWLPVSSTGHLILVGDILQPDLSDAFMEMFNVVIQLGAIMAVVVLYFHKLNPFSPKKTQKQKLLTWQMWIKVLIASVPAAVVGLLFNDYLDAIFYKPLPEQTRSPEGDKDLGAVRPDAGLDRGVPDAGSHSRDIQVRCHDSGSPHDRDI